MQLSVEHRQQILEPLATKRIGLVGDLFLDRYLELQPGVREISIETGLEAYQIESVRNAPGALGTVMNNLAALGVRELCPLTVIGDDGHGFDLRRAMEDLPLDASSIVVAPDRLTPTYTKPIYRDVDGSWAEHNRLDIKSREPISSTIMAKVLDQLQKLYASCDGVIVLDQVVESNLGVVTGDVRDALAECIEQYPTIPTLIDSRSHLGEFTQGICKGNLSEVTHASSIDQASPEQAVTEISRRTGQACFCTCGEEGVVIGRPDDEPLRVPGVEVPPPIDIVGAGDSVSSGIMAALLSDQDVATAASFGNLVASITIRQIGTTGVATPKQVLEA